MANVDAAVRSLTDLVEGRGMFGVSAEEDLKWAMKMAGNALAALTQPTHRHVKRGSEYRYIGSARIQTEVPLNDMDRVEIYQGAGDDDLWARRAVEFLDGRFEPVEISDER